MAYDSRKNGLRRQEAVGMEELVTQFIRDMKLSSGLGKQRACEAWGWCEPRSGQRNDSGVSRKN